MKKQAQVVNKPFSKRTNIIIVIVIVVALLILVLKYPPGMLTHDTAITVGRITETRYVPKWSYDRLNYEYIIDGKTFSDASSVDVKREYTRQFVGKYFPVVYSKIDTSISELIVEPEDFKRFNIPFPDSLNWVLDKLP